jgi:His-Xaa-Ser system radical SAM maturase HxsB
LTHLQKGFAGREAYAVDDQGYALLPFRFRTLEEEKYFLSNLVGEWLVVLREELERFVRHRLEPNDPLYLELKSRHFLLDSTSDVALDLLAAKYRTRFANLPELAGLHIYVMTLRCNQSCRYCQATRHTHDQSGFDMTRDTATLAVDFMFQSPSRVLKVEFQGGEPTLNFDVLRHIVTLCEERASTGCRTVEFVLCSNLVEMTDEVWDYLADHKIQVSTSLDGPQMIHDAGRVYPGGSAHERFCQNLRTGRDRLGPNAISALMTGTRSSLPNARQVIDEYLRQGFTSIFLRPLNPYGFAARNEAELSYSVTEWVAFFREGLAYIIELNDQGIAFREQYCGLILRRMLTPFGHGYVDLQSPTGSGTGVLVYNYDGGIYASDESRMLAAMGDDRFRFGWLGSTSFTEMVNSEGYRSFVSNTMLEGVPMCVECAYLPYCGSDPIRHYREQGDIIGFKPTSIFCQKQRAVIEHIVKLYEEDARAREVLSGWA